MKSFFGLLLLALLAGCTQQIAFVRSDGEGRMSKE
jgi:hypothetical protein